MNNKSIIIDEPKKTNKRDAYNFLKGLFKRVEKFEMKEHSRHEKVETYIDQFSEFNIDNIDDSLSAFQNRSYIGNFNIAISGNAGSGKESLIKEIVQQALDKESRAYIIESVNPKYYGFSDITKKNNGQIININRSNGINPFSLIKESNNNENNSIESIICSIVCNIFRPIEYVTSSVEDKPEDITEEERVIILSATQKTIQENGSKGNFNILSDNLVKVCYEKTQRNIAQNIKESLDMFLEKNGEYLEGTFNIEDSKNSILFNTYELSYDSEIVISTIHLILLKIIEELIIRNRSKHGSYLIMKDIRHEAPHLEVLKHISSITRRIRKMRGGVITSVQNAIGYYENKEAESIFENSSVKVFLKQKQHSWQESLKEKPSSFLYSLPRTLQYLKKIIGEYSDYLIYDDINNKWTLGRVIINK